MSGTVLGVRDKTDKNTLPQMELKIIIFKKTKKCYFLLPWPCFSLVNSVHSVDIKFSDCFKIFYKLIAYQNLMTLENIKRQNRYYLFSYVF